MSVPDDELVRAVRRHGDIGLPTPDPGAIDRIAQDVAGRASAARGRRRWLPLIAGSAIVVTAAGAATAATGVWSPQLGDERRGTPSISRSEAPPEQLKHFAVLRRPQTDQDRGADVRRVLRRFVGGSYRGVRTASVRRVVATDGGGPRIIVPAVRANGFDDALCLFVRGGGSTCVTTDRVLTGSSLSFSVREAPLTAAQRRQNLREFARADRITKARRRALLRRLSPLPRDRAARRRLLERAYAEENLNGMSVRTALPRAIDTRFYGIVPDGVDQVARTDQRGRHATTVQENTYRLVVPGRAEGRGSWIWLDAQGKTIRTFER